MKLEGSCHCGSVRLATAAAPDFFNCCNCSLCRKSGAVWGYFQSAEIQVSGETATYQRADKSSAAVDLHFCPQCGSTTHFTLTTGFTANFPDTDRVGINMRLFDSKEFAGIELRFPNGREWSGKGAFDHWRDSVILKAGDEF